jgi:hypothetical protein
MYAATLWGSQPPYRVLQAKSQMTETSEQDRGKGQQHPIQHVTSRERECSEAGGPPPLPPPPPSGTTPASNPAHCSTTTHISWTCFEVKGGPSKSSSPHSAEAVDPKKSMSASSTSCE